MEFINKMCDIDRRIFHKDQRIEIETNIDSKNRLSK